jgi:uncharacterized lipoprotein NlpE involved in copper resistance
MIDKNCHRARSISQLSITIGLISLMLVGCNNNSDRENSQQSTGSNHRTKIETDNGNVRVENNQTTKIVGNNRDPQVSNRTSITTNDRGETKTETSTENNTSDRQNLAATKIADGRYWLGSTDEALEVRGDRYRYDTEGGERPWQSISTLKSIDKGVVFDGKTYWCLSSLAPDPPTGCSATGWSK